MLRLVISCCLLSVAAASAFAEDLKVAVILNSSVYAPGELYDLYRPHLGQRVDEKTANTIAEALRDKYSADGYARPGYRVLDAGVETGIVRIQMTEARISRVEFDGDVGPYDETLQRLLGGLPSNPSFRPNEVRETLQRARRLRGLDLDFKTVADADESGAYVMQVVSEYKPFGGSARLSNRGTREIGRNLVTGTFAANGIVGSDSTTSVYFASARHSRNYRIGGIILNAAAGSKGTTVQVGGSAAALEIDSSGVVLAQGRERFTLKVSHPLTLESGREMSIWTGLDVDNLELQQDGVESRDDRLRSVDSGMSLKWRGDASANLLMFELQLGISAFGGQLNDIGNPDDRRENNYAISTLHYVHLRELSDVWALRWDSYLQHSPHVLPSIKRFKVGGNRIGRGFEAAAVSGDRGIGNKLELKRRWGLGSPALNLSDVYGFYDLGSAWRNDSSGRESAASVGIGLSVDGDWLAASVEVARPLTHADVDGKRDSGIFVEISARY